MVFRSPMAERKVVKVRMSRAITEARSTVRRCDVVALLSAARHARQLTNRCAWCDRYELQGKWVDLSDLGSYTGGELGGTHGICPDCLEGLARTHSATATGVTGTS